MTPAEARAEVFLTAFKSLNHNDQETFFSKLFKNTRLREDIIDLAIAEDKKYERTKSFSGVVAEIKEKRRK